MERIVEAGFLLVLALPLVRIGIEPGLRRRFQAFPPIQALIVASTCAYVLAILAAAMFAPMLLRVAAIPAFGILIAIAWQSRPSYGSGRGLPRGSLAPLPIGPWRDPHYYRKQVERHGPVFKFRHMLEPAVGIAGLERASDFLRTQEQNLLIPPAPFNALIPGGFVRYMSGAQHRGTAGLLRSAFTPAVLASCEADFAELSRATVESIATSDDGSSAASHIERLALNEMMLCFVGVEPGPQLDELERLYHVADYRRLAQVGQDRARTAILEIIREMRTLAARPADSVGARRSFLSELAGSHPEAIDDDAAMGNFAYALHTARLDVAGLLAWLIATLGENPAWVAKLREAVHSDECAAIRPGGLADRMVRETLRLRQSEFLLRRVKQPIDWNGYNIPAGWHVRICVAESHRSAEAFDQPDVFDADRFIQPPDRTRYSPFGYAPHLCPGEHLTRAMGRHLAAAVARRYDVSAANVEPWEFSGFHWRPNAKMRIALTPSA